MPLHLNEIFETIQGEAYYTGSPSIFVRLQGCDVGCPWCDTKHTWPFSHHTDMRSLQEIIDKSEDAPTWAMVDETELIEHIRKLHSQHVVITGGEPCEHDLREFTAGLIYAGRTVQIETSGTREVRAHPSAWVTVSPKIDMPGGYKVLQQAMDAANEIKMPVGKKADINKLLDLIERFRPHRKLIWLQPLSTSEKATELCIEAAREHGWRVSIQTHKFIGVR